MGLAPKFKQWVDSIDCHNGIKELDNEYRFTISLKDCYRVKIDVKLGTFKSLEIGGYISYIKDVEVLSIFNANNSMVIPHDKEHFEYLARKLESLFKHEGYQGLINRYNNKKRQELLNTIDSCFE